MGKITGLLKKEDYKSVFYDLPDDIYVYYITGRIYDGKAIIKYKDSSNEEVSIQSSKCENGFFYAIYNTNFHLAISLDK